MMAITDRLPFRRKTNPPPAPKPEARFAFLTETLLDRFYVRRIQAFWNDLEATGNLMPFVIPLLAWIGWRTYRAERRKVQQRPYNFIDKG